MIDAGGRALLGVVTKAVHGKHRHHHFQTLRMVELLRIELMKQGKEVVRVDLEDELRARILSKGKKAELKRAMEHGPVNLNDAVGSVEGVGGGAKPMRRGGRGRQTDAKGWRTRSDNGPDNWSPSLRPVRLMRVFTGITVVRIFYPFNPVGSVGVSLGSSRSEHSA